MGIQQDVDYINDCQRRVAADTAVLQTKTTVTLAAGAASVAVPDDATQLLAVYDGVTPLPQINQLEYMLLASSSGHDQPGVLAWCVVGRSILFSSTPSADHTITLVYQRRSADLASASDLEVTGEYVRLVERLVGAYELLDDGQPELAQAELGQYDRDAARLRLRSARGHGPPTRMTLRGRR